MDNTKQLITALEAALDALNTAPRFRVGTTDSYKIATQCKAALKAAAADNTSREVRK